MLASRLLPHRWRLDHRLQVAPCAREATGRQGCGERKQVAVAASAQNRPYLDSYQEVNYEFLALPRIGEVELTWLEGQYSSSRRLRQILLVQRAKLTGLDDFNVAIAELSQTEAVVSSLVLGYMFLGDTIERMVRGK